MFFPNITHTPTFWIPIDLSIRVFVGIDHPPSCKSLDHNTPPPLQPVWSTPLGWNEQLWRLDIEHNDLLLDAGNDYVAYVCPTKREWDLINPLLAHIR